LGHRAGETWPGQDLGHLDGRETVAGSDLLGHCAERNPWLARIWGISMAGKPWQGRICWATALKETLAGQDLGHLDGRETLAGSDLF
jgi:hypothetical protein